MEDAIIVDGDPIVDLETDGESDIVISVGHETVVVPIQIAENGHYEPDAGTDGFSSVDVDVKYQNLIDYINEITGGEDTSLSDAVATLVEGYGGFSIDDIALNRNLGNVVITANEIKTNAFYNRAITSIVAPNVTTIRDYAFLSSTIQQIELPKVATFGAQVFKSSWLQDIKAQAITNIPSYTFDACKSLTNVYLPKVKSIQTYAFRQCSALTSLKLPSCTSIANTTTVFGSCPNLRDIYLPNDASTYTGAPWGATNATIHFNTVFDENGEPILN